MSRPAKSPSLLDVFVPVLVLIAGLLAIIFTFQDDAGGYTSLALMASAAAACLVGVKNGQSWQYLEQGMVKSVGGGLKAILILLTVGALVGGLILAGTVPAMIYWGTQLMSPQWFYLATALICAITGLSIGSSWTVAGALGVGLMGAAIAMGLSPAITAGAVISGAYLGDKLSPLSDTTNLAAGITGNDLFHHIRHMGWTTIPAFTIALMVYAIAGFGVGDVEISSNLAQVNDTLEQQFYLGFPVFLPLAIIFTLAIWRKPVLPALWLGVLSTVLVALWVQRSRIYGLAGGEDVSDLFKGVALALMDGFSIETGSTMLDKLLSKGGMSNMLSTVFLIVCALSFGGAYERSGLLERAIKAILSGVKTVGGLISATLATCVGTNVACADQYIAIVVPSKMYKDVYRERGLHGLNLSRAVEDAGTLTSVLVPWNTCGLFMASTLGVATWAYAPWAVLCWVCPMISALYGYLSFRILPLESAGNGARTSGSANSEIAH